MAIYIAQKEDLVSEYDDSGFAKKKRFRVLMKAESGITSVF